MTTPSLYGNARQSAWSARRAAAWTVHQVCRGKSLNGLIAETEVRVCDTDRGFYRELTLGSCRHYQRLNAISKILLSQPFNDEDQDLHSLLIIGLYQLVVLGKAPHAAVHATVECATEMGKQYAKSVINACLRRYGREYEQILPPLDNNPVTQTSHPKWLVKTLKKDWPNQWQDILQENNHPAPLCLRVNRRFCSRDAYLLRMQHAGLNAQRAPFSDDGLYWLDAGDVRQLPNFDDGHVSVQDEAAQLAAKLLQPQPGERILDACAAPGGKSAHLLEFGCTDLLAIDIDEQRSQRIADNLQRLQLTAELKIGDLRQPDEWWDGKLFDAILLDVPCSATGVIRRHPDIKLLRRREDIDALQQTQRAIFERVWPTLKPGGRLLYATCSVLAAENEQQIQHIVDHYPEAKSVTIAAGWGMPTAHGRQLFPQTESHDGFFYALLEKIN